MDLKTLRAELQKLAALAEGWDASHEIADIERDLALGKLRELYDAVRFGLDSAVQPSVEDELSSVDLPPVEIYLDAVIPLTAMSEPFGADPAAAPLEEPTIAPPVVESCAKTLNEMLSFLCLLKLDGAIIFRALLRKAT